MGVGGQRHAPVALPWERASARSNGSWFDPWAGVDGCGKSLPRRNSIPGSSSP